MPPFENQFVQEETTSAVPPAGGSDTLDQFRMSIGQEGFRNIDTNGSGTLSLDELQTALRQDIYDPEQKTAIG